MSAFRSRRVLIVGGLGFIGGNLSRRLARDGAAVTVVTPLRARHEADAAELESVGARIVEGDVRERDQMTRAVAGQDVIVNLAGRSGAVRSMQDPWTDLDVNCGGALSLLEAMKTANSDAMLVVTGSRLEYGRVGSNPVNETHAADPLCVHAIHKLTIERYLALYRRLFGIRSVVARLTNPYGPGQPRARTAYGVVNRMIHLALGGEALPIFGDGRQQRDYIYIDDAVEALLALAASDTAEGVYNVGTGAGTALVDMARAIVAIAGSGRIEHVEWPPLAEQIETGDFIADVSRIRRDVGWRAAVTLGDGLQRTVSHYRAHVPS
ncbi:MAG TPA: SDR family NAD(P)-dependent oxidoreductase [Vicinamibacterales bacterium]|nr:SDR family NAD(P)-dependent oxidoreductase [Vicinamibacterales bacterium]